MYAAIIIPFRDRGIDPLRRANMDRILEHWSGYDTDVFEVSDGKANGQFNRSAAYNLGADSIAADVYVYTESDMILNYDQISNGVDLALAHPGLVVPFTQYRYLSESDSALVRKYPDVDPMDLNPESTMENGSSIGAVNIISRKTLNLIGQWDEGFSGNWYDDNAMKIAFELAAGPTRWVDGPATHLYHLPGWAGSHLTDEDRAATERNRLRLGLYEQARTADDIRQLTTGKR